MAITEERDYTEPISGDEDDWDEDFLSDEYQEEELDPESEQFFAQLIDRIWLFVVEFAGIETFPFPYQEIAGKRIIESVVKGDGQTLTELFARQCLDADTVILRRDGSACRIRDHEDAWCTGVKSVKRYRFQGGAEVVCTDNHPLMTEEGWVPAGALEVGSQVLTLESWAQWQYKGVDKQWSRILGYYTTDGSGPGKSAGGRQSPKFTNTSAACLSEFEDLVQKRFGMIAKRYPKGDGFDLLLTEASRRKNSFTRQVRNLSWDHGFPTDVFRWAPEMVSEFVNRAWSGDGCVRQGSRTPEVFLACGNDEIYARYWQMLLWKLGVASTVKREQMEKGTGTFHRLVVGVGARNLRRFFTVTGLIFSKESQSIAVLDYLAEKAGRPSGKGRVERMMRPVIRSGLDGENFSKSKIISIEPLGEREVWDVTYEGKGWFVAQGVYVSNSGKTELVANVVAGLMVILPKLAVMFPNTLGKFKRGFWVGAFAPTDEQVSILFSRVCERLSSERAEEIMAEPEIDDEAKQNQKQVRLKRSGSIFRMQTANPRAKIEGRTYHLILIDEAQDVDEFVVSKSIRPMKAFFNGSLVMTGTPQIVKGIFYKTIQINKRLENQRGGKRNHYEFDYQHVCRVNKNYRAHVRQEALELGEDSDEFRLAYKLEWLLDRGMFITEEQFKDLGDRQANLVHAYFRSPCLVGIDPARKVDSTVVTVMWVDWDRPDDLGYFRHHILNWLEIHGEDWEDQYFRIVEFLANYNVLAIAVDGNGMGGPVAERLQVLMPEIQVIALPADNTAQSARWKHLMQLVQRQMITWPAHPKTRRLKLWKRFQQQMQDAEKKYQNGHLLVEAPDERGAHDDFPDSAALAAYLSKEFIVPEVEQGSNPMYSHRRR